MKHSVSLSLMLMNIDDMDPTDINRRLEGLRAIENRSGPEEKTLKALQKQIDVYNETRQEIEDLLARNEEALATMDQTGQVALRVKTHSQDQTPEETMAEAMRLLTEMISRAKTSPIIALKQTIA